ncbi:uncharacterized protein JCM6883_002894 [Sporobolomyces salmoneus]|uniref:uncharacterized protein n=1 Tax=Sporobolomyces salmoneus TaxID=183962 RepID=UPI00316F7E84
MRPPQPTSSLYKPPLGTSLSLPLRSGFHAWLTIDGIPAPLYHLESRPGRTVCYVESRVGASFAVNFSQEGSSRAKGEKGFQAAVSIDGQWQRGKNITKEALPGLWALSGKRDSDSTERPFVFGELSTTSHDQFASTSEQALQSLGSIELRYRRIKKIKPRTSNIKGEYETPENPQTFHEDSKAAVLDHQSRRVTVPSLHSVRNVPDVFGLFTCRLGPSQIAQFKEERQNKYVYHESKGDPYHTFRFFYRSRTIPTNPEISTSLDSSLPNPSTSTPFPAARSRSIAASSSSSSSTNRSRRLSHTAETEPSPFFSTHKQLASAHDPPGQSSISLHEEESSNAEQIRLIDEKLRELEEITAQYHKMKRRDSERIDGDEGGAFGEGEGEGEEGHTRKRPRIQREKEPEVIVID